MKSLQTATKLKARQRAELIFKVRSGQMTATEAARTLGISRQQYYQWDPRSGRNDCRRRAVHDFAYSAARQ